LFYVLSWRKLTFQSIFLSSSTVPPPCREADDGSKKHMERLLNIWKERALYRADFIQQLKLAIEDSNSPRPSGEMTLELRSQPKRCKFFAGVDPMQSQHTDASGCDRRKNSPEAELQKPISVELLRHW